MIRTQRFLTALALCVGICFSLAVCGVLFYVVSAIAYSGSTGNAHDAFLNSSAPFGRFVLGAALASCAGLLVNSVATRDGVWVWAIVFLAFAGGFVFAVSPRTAHAALEATKPVLGWTAKLLLSK